jgi:nucleoside-diphosphate-sugar epimerase
MSKILLTGGSGFIGEYFQRLISGQDLINLDLVEPKFSYTSRFFQGDIRREADIRAALQGQQVTTIISLAAKHHDFGIGHDEYFDTNEDGTAAICKVATENNINEIIFYSSVAVYGNLDAVSSEAVNPAPSAPYGASKLAGEKVLEKWAAGSPDRKVIIIRPAVVFGPGNTANMYNLINQIDSGLYFHLGKGDNIKSIAYVENVVKATLFLKDRIKPGVAIYNYADEPQLTSRQISEAVAKALGKKIRITVPRSLGIMLGLPFDLAIKLTGKNLPISSARIRKLGTQTFHGARKIVNEGFKAEWTTIDGLGKMVEWFQKRKTK